MTDADSRPAVVGQVDVDVRPVAWLHDQPERYEALHDKAKALWLKAKPKQVEHYTIPLYRHVERHPLSTEAACSLLKNELGIDPMLNGNMLKIVRLVEQAHGIGHSVAISGGPTEDGDKDAADSHILAPQPPAKLPRRLT